MVSLHSRFGAASGSWMLTVRDQRLLTRTPHSGKGNRSSPPFSINSWTQRFNLDVLPMFGIQLVETCSVIPPPTPTPSRDGQHFNTVSHLPQQHLKPAPSGPRHTRFLSPSPLHPICQRALPLLLCTVSRFCCFLSVSSGSALVRTLLPSPLAAGTAASSY